MRRIGAAAAAALGGGCGGDVAVVGVEVLFDATAAGRSAACGVAFGFGDPPVEAQLRDLRLYVSRVAAIDGDGVEVPIALAADGEWQDDDVALLDFEDQTGACSWGGTAGTNRSVRGWLPAAGRWTGLSFELAVPVDGRHLDIGAAAPPLDVSGLFWGWTTGYKFLTVAVERGAAEGPAPWTADIGSTRCAALSDDRADVACANPNVAAITLTGADPTTTGVVFDLDALVAGVDLTDPALTDCMSGPAERAACAPVFDNLGLDFDTGRCAPAGVGGACSGQSAFRWAESP